MPGGFVDPVCGVRDGFSTPLFAGNRGFALPIPRLPGSICRSYPAGVIRAFRRLSLAMALAYPHETRTDFPRPCRRRRPAAIPSQAFHHLPMRFLVRLRALAIALTDLTAHAADPTDTWRRSSTIAEIRHRASEGSRTAKRPRGGVALAPYDRLKPALDAGRLSSTHSSSSAVRPMDQDAIAYAWLLNDESADLIAAGDSTPSTKSDGAARLDA